MCRKLIFGRVIGLGVGGVGASSGCGFDLSFNLTIVTLSFKIFSGQYLRNSMM